MAFRVCSLFAVPLRAASPVRALLAAVSTCLPVTVSTLPFVAVSSCGLLVVVSARLPVFVHSRCVGIRLRVLARARSVDTGLLVLVSSRLLAWLGSSLLVVLGVSILKQKMYRDQYAKAVAVRSLLLWLT